MSDTSPSLVRPPKPHPPEAAVGFAAAPDARLTPDQLEAARKVLQHIRPVAAPDGGVVTDPLAGA